MALKDGLQNALKAAVGGLTVSGNGRDRGQDPASEPVRSEEDFRAAGEKVRVSGTEPPPDAVAEEGGLVATAYPRVRFTGQQPGEEAVEKDQEPDEQDEDPEDEREVDEDGERLVPIKEPTHKIPRV